MERSALPGKNREQILAEWIDRYSDSIYRTCFLYLSDLQLAEDALQDTWIKAWKHMDDLENGRILNEKAWLLRIAMNTCRDYRRTAWFRHTDRSRALDELPDRVLTVMPDDRTLSFLIMELPNRYKQVILLYFYQGLTIQETADALNVSVSTAHRRLNRAEELLKHLLEGGNAHES